MSFIRRALFTVLILLIGISTVKAQLLNVERIRTFADSTGWHGDLGFDLSVNKYNDRIFKLGNQANAAYYSNLHSYVFLTNLEIINVDGSSLVSSGYAHLRSVFFRERTLSPELFVQHQYNNNLGLRGRALGGAGIRYTFLSREAITGRFSTALMQEYENWRLSGEEAIENNFLKSTNNISLRGNLSDQTSLLLIGYYQARPSRLLEPRVTFESQLNIRMSRWVLFSVSFVLTHDANPVIEIPKLTYELKNGILISF